jgi:hypothetical protein
MGCSSSKEETFPVPQPEAKPLTEAEKRAQEEKAAINAKIAASLAAKPIQEKEAFESKFGKKGKGRHDIKRAGANEDGSSGLRKSEVESIRKRALEKARAQARARAVSGWRRAGEFAHKVKDTIVHDAHVIEHIVTRRSHISRTSTSRSSTGRHPGHDLHRESLGHSISHLVLANRFTRSLSRLLHKPQTRSSTASRHWFPVPQPENKPLKGSFSRAHAKDGQTTDDAAGPSGKSVLEATSGPTEGGVADSGEETPAPASGQSTDGPAENNMAA